MTSVLIRFADATDKKLCKKKQVYIQGELSFETQRENWAIRWCETVRDGLVGCLQRKYVDERLQCILLNHVLAYTAIKLHQVWIKQFCIGIT